jgi:hypothetical protein
VDPETGDVYTFASEEEAETGSSAGHPGLSQVVRDRLVHRASDQPHALEAINFTIAASIEELQPRYAKVWRSIAAPASSSASSSSNVAAAAEASKLAVFEQIEDFLLAPLNAAYAHKQQQQQQPSADEQ